MFSNFPVGIRAPEPQQPTGPLPSPMAMAALRSPVIQAAAAAVRGAQEAVRDTVGPAMPNASLPKPAWLSQGAAAFSMAQLGKAAESTPAYRLASAGMAAASSFMANDTAAGEGSATAMAGLAVMRTSPGLAAMSRGFGQMNAAASLVTAGKTMGDAKATHLEKVMAVGSLVDRTGMLSSAGTALAGAREKDMPKFVSGFAQVTANVGLTVAAAARANPRTMLALTMARGAIAMAPDFLPKA